MNRTPFAAVILCGGRSSRMGTDKALLLWEGRRLVDVAADLARGLGADPVMTAGADHGLPFIPDATPFGGPVGGILASAEALGGAGVRRVLFLSVDAPTLQPHDLKPLIEAAAPGAAYDGFPLPAVIDLVALPPDAEPGWRLRRLAEDAGLAILPCPWPDRRLRLRGANTPEEWAALGSQTAPEAPAERRH